MHMGSQPTAQCPLTMYIARRNQLVHSAAQVRELDCRIRKPSSIPSSLHADAWLSIGNKQGVPTVVLEPKILAEPLAWPLWERHSHALPRDKLRSQEECERGARGRKNRICAI